MTTDEKYMKIAIELARRGLGRTSPNPPVGAIIVRDGKIIGRGWHKRAGLPHAEVEAISDAIAGGSNDFLDATMYVTLEPCCHYGRTPPCVGMIVERGFRRIVIGTVDPNPEVCGKGIEALQKANIDVEQGILEYKAKKLIEPFETFIKKKRAYLALKWAQSVDGKIAASDGSSKWISSPKSRKFVHKLRNEYDAVIIGSGTLLRDNPELTVRLVRGRNPIRVVICGQRKIDADMRLFNDNAAQTIIVSPHENPFADKLPKCEVIIWKIEPESDGKVSIRAVLSKLASIGITSALLEGGSALIGSALREKVADRIYAIVAPSIIGIAGIHFANFISGASINEALQLVDVEYKRIGRDILISAKPAYQ